MAKYTGSPIEFFLSLPMDEFYSWVEINNEEIKREQKANK